MFPASFEYVRAHSSDEAFSLLQQHGDEGRVLAGGQSLIPAMRYRLARPGVLVDINPIKELDYLIEEGGFLRIGATTRDAALEFAPWIRERYSLITSVSGVVADPIVRHMGTVVGSVCHNDPAGDWTATALAARGVVVVRGRDGLREVPIDEFLVDSYTTAVKEGEMALELKIPIPDGRTQGSYQKIERKVGDYATCAAAVQLSLNPDGTIRQAGIAITAAGPIALRVVEAEAMLIGQLPTPALFQAAAAEAPKIATPNPDQRGSVAYKKDMARVLVGRGLKQALQRLEAGQGGGVSA
ncbi:xanthine dehydrogenase family protein subunit M [Deinococcus sp. AJ005]|uniref:FAD binding domain-containing protein n=1 Tax=Deinococcus sp. AJ005 TaxID=2652443 RepID=UPI00125CC424|nr:xanthine dehydrogenase family protein subunit M [Deinococcus sp. AJ005]QFP75086.1 xanthine dehydrogenase family protein subunit M [Deinococcus sp. AJ005]